jgi:mRNA interferase RelE/StbE
MHRIELLPSAARSLEKTPTAVRRRLARAIEALARNPHPPASQRLRGAQNVWRVRVADYRVLYQVLDSVLLVLIVRIGHRRDVYR